MGVLETRTNDKKCPETDIQPTVNRMVAGSNPARGAIRLFLSSLFAAVHYTSATGCNSGGLGKLYYLGSAQSISYVRSRSQRGGGSSVKEAAFSSSCSALRHKPK